MSTTEDTLSLVSQSAKDGRGSALRPHLFLSFSADRPVNSSARFALADVDLILLGRGSRDLYFSREQSGSERRLAIQVADRRVSSDHARIVRVLDRFVLEDVGSKNGTFVNAVATKKRELVEGDVIELGRTFFIFRQGLPTRDTDPLDLVLDPAIARPGMSTLLPEFGGELARLTDIAASEVSVLTSGESGTGKELIARSIHQLSKRTGDFVAVNCGALPANLVETELFGYKKGAFSGAEEDRPGLVRSAHRGTLFLDEIGDLAADSQAALLRVLEEREVHPVGATRPVQVDVRFLAATHRDLLMLVEAERFRRDLYARIQGWLLSLPPLRERREDLALMTAQLIVRSAGDQAGQVRLEPEVVRALLSHPWPLNVRELEKAIASAIVVAGGTPLSLEHLPAALRSSSEGSPSAAAAAGSTRAGGSAQETLVAPIKLSAADRARRSELEALLKEHGGNVTAVARAMGKARVQVQRWMRRFALRGDDYKE